MGGSDQPDPLPFVVFPPAKNLGTGAHQPGKDFACVGRMEQHKPHALQHPALKRVHPLVGNLPPVLVAEIDNHVRPIQQLVGKTEIRILHHGGADAAVRLLPEKLGQSAVDSFGIQALFGFRRLRQGLVFVPAEKVHSCSTSTQRRSFDERTQASTKAMPRKPSSKEA